MPVANWAATVELVLKRVFMESVDGGTDDTGLWGSGVRVRLGLIWAHTLGCRGSSHTGA